MVKISVRCSKETVIKFSSGNHIAWRQKVICFLLCMAIHLVSNMSPVFVNFTEIEYDSGSPAIVCSLTHYWECIG